MEAMDMRSMSIYEAARFSNRPEVGGDFSFLRLVCSDSAELYELRAEWSGHDWRCVDSVMGLRSRKR